MANSTWLSVIGRRRSATCHLPLFTYYLSLITFFLLTACSSVPPVVKVGLVAPFEGANRDLGYDAIYAARLAVREINEAGGIEGYRVALVALDDRGDEEMAVDIADSLTVDPAIVGVVGHGLERTTAVAQPVYSKAGMPLLPLGNFPFVTQDPALLPTDFQAAYNDVTPFDETAGPYAAATYDAMQLLFQAMAAGKAATGTIDRTSVTNALTELKYDGLVGTVYQP